MTPYLKSISLLLLTAFSSTSAIAEESYVIDRLAFPDDMPPEVGGLEFASDGTLYVALRRGDILTAKPSDDPKAFKWKRFATGFHNACGIHIVKPGHIVIGQMAELTEVIDHDGDGTADEYKNLSTGFGLTGNYHETMDICSDNKGGYYIAPGTASHNGPTFGTLRGPYSKIGRYGRNFSAGQYRGWVLHVAADGKVTPISSGYRMHNGIERAPNGTIWCGDNQGDWRAASPIYHVTEDSFMGHPASLTWDKRFESIANPLYMPRILLDDLWNKPAFHLPHSMIRSCAEPVFDTTGGTFGPFEGQMLVPDQSGMNIVRCMPEMVDGAYQGAAIVSQFSDLSRGNNRLAFSPEGDTLYVGQTGRGWGALSEGIQRIRYTGTLPFDVKNCSLTEKGFRITMTKALAADSVTAEQIKIERYRYQYAYTYGSKEQDKAMIPVTKVSIDRNDPRSFDLELKEMVPNYIYKISITPKSSKGEAFNARPIIYTMNRLRRPASDNQVTIVKNGEKSLRIEIDGKPFTEYHLSGFSNPILYPILNANGTGMTRDWPVIENGRKGEAKDHVHHKALFIGHQGQNKVDFWHEGEKMGKTEHARLIETRSGEDRALIRTFNLWKDAAGKVICSDTRELKFGMVNGARFIDLELNMHASNGDLTFNTFKDGFVGLRMHPHLRLTAKPKAGVPQVFGKAANSEGIEGKAIWGKRANWVHYYGKVEGKDAGIAILAHPDNPRSPTWWHARDYGLVSANPFAPEKIGGDGALVIPNGDSLTLRYRFLFHDQSADAADIAAQHKAYSNEILAPRTVVIPIPGNAETSTIKAP